VDPLIRQLTLGHAPPSMFGANSLGMTSVYTHTRPETQRREIERVPGSGRSLWNWFFTNARRVSDERFEVY
jgi:hypothetical protein